MAAVARQRSPATLPLRLALAAVVALSILIGGIELALFARTGGPQAWLVSLFTVTGFVYAAAGLVAWWRRPSNHIGAIMVAGAYAWFVVALNNTDVPALACVAVVTATAPLAMVVHIVLAFPSGRLRSPAVRWIVAAGFFVVLALQAPTYLFAPAASPDGWLAVADEPVWESVGVWVQRCAGLAVMVATASVLLHRLRRATRAQQRVLAPLYTYGVVAVLVTPLAPYVIQPLLHLSLEATVCLQLASLGGVPVAFALGMLRGGFARTSEIQELGAWLAAPGVGRPSLEVALAHTLGDPTLRLGYWSPTRSSFHDAAGAALPDGDHGRATVTIETDGAPVGAIDYDPILNDDPELVRSAGRVVAIAIEQERLTADLRSSERALQVAGRRIVEAADRERGRIGQDLHDGMQAQLVAIALNAQQIAAEPGATPRIRRMATTLRTEVDSSARELRALVHDILPAALLERGLGAAVEDLTDRMAVPTRLVLTELACPLSATTQRTGYFVVAEALTNAVRHAHANNLQVRLVQDDSVLAIDVADDGVGGARIGAGLGLRGLADRIALLGGRLTVTSPPGGGTRVQAEIPCES